MLQADYCVISSREFTWAHPEPSVAKRVCKTNKRLLFHKISACSKSPNNTRNVKVRKNGIAPSQTFLSKFKVLRLSENDWHLRDRAKTVGVQKNKRYSVNFQAILH